MPSPLRRVPLVLAALALAGPAAATPHRLDGVTVDVPAGWTVQTATNGLILQKKFPGESRTAAALIGISSTRLTGTFDAAFVAATTALEGLKDEDPIVDVEGETTLGFPMRWETRCCGSGGGPSVSQTTVAFAPAGRFVSASLIDIGLGDDDEEAVEADFAAIVASLDFTAAGGKRPPVPRALGYGTPLEGFFTHTEGTVRPNVFGGMEFVSDTTTYMFDPSGRFSEEPPLAGRTIADACAADSEGCGIYTVIGNRIAMKTVGRSYGIVTTETMPVERMGDGLKLDEDVFSVVQPERDLKLDGTWTYFWAQTGTGAFNSGSISSTNTLTLTRAGRFDRSGSTSFMTANDVGDSTVRTAGNSDRPVVRGRYRIDGFTLTLIDDSGSVKELSIYRPDEGDIDLLMIDGSPYLREGRD